MTNRGVRIRAVADHAWAVWVAILSMATCVVYFAFPEVLSSSSVGEAFHPYDQVWNGLYGVGGLLIFVGIVFLRPAIDVCGLILLGGATALQTAAQIIAPPHVPLPVLATIVRGLLFAVIALRVWRIYDLEKRDV